MKAFFASNDKKKGEKLKCISLKSSFFFLSPLFIIALCFPYAICAGDGDLDPTFGGVGYVMVSLGSEGRAFGVALQADGNIVSVGSIGTIPNTDWVVVRLTPDGNLDTTFGGTGFVTLDFGGEDRANGVAIQSDGKIVVVGTGNDDISVARYNTDGSLDTTFNGTGFVTAVFGGSLGTGVALQADGKIVVSGRSGSPAMFTVVRYNTDGSLDTTFNGTGFVVTDASGAGSFSEANSILIQPDGKIVVGGDASVGINADFAVARYNTDGSLDTTFGTNGIVLTDIGSNIDNVFGLALQSDGKIIGAGFKVSPQNFVTARYTTAGVLDTATFNSPIGYVITPIGSSSSARAVTLQDDDRILVVGTADVSGSRFALVRYNDNGTLDSSFGPGGIVTTDFGVVFSVINAVVVQPDRKIVVAGIVANEGNATFTVARYGDFGPCKLLIGSDSVLNIFNTQQLVAQGGRLAKLALLNGGFGLCGDATFASCFPVAGSICLECFTLTLENDLIMNNVSYIGSTGNIVGNSHILDLAKSVEVIPTFVCTATAIQPAEPCPHIEWGNLTVRLNGDVTLNDTIVTFTGESAIRGNGHTLTLNNSELLVGSDATLLFDNVIIDRVHDGVVRCIDDSSTIQLYDTQWLLDNDFTFSIGRFNVIGTFDIVGDGFSFIYQSPVVSTIDQNGTMILNSGLTFEYDPSIAIRDLLQLTDATSQLILNGSTLHSTETGLQLTRGSLIVDQTSFIVSEALVKAEGIMFGDGINVENNLNVHIAPAAVLEVTSGFLVQEDA